MKTAPPQPARPPGYRILPLMVLGFCLIATWLVWNQSRRRDEMALWGEFNFMANKSLSAMENHLNADIQVLRGVAALFATSRHVDRHEFHEYLVALEMEELYPGILGIGYSQVIPGGEKERHLARIRGEGFPDYAIHPPGGRELFTSVIYLEPFSGRNLRSFGYDMYSEPVLRAAMVQARDEGEPALSGKVILAEESGIDAQAGFVLYVPVYGEGTPHSNVVERRANLIGWAFSPLRVKEMMLTLFSHHSWEMGRLLDVHVYDGEAINPATLMYATKEELPRPLFETDRKLKVAGHVWTVRMHSLPLFDSRMGSERGPIIRAIGCGMSLLLALLTWILVRSREKIALSLWETDQANRGVALSEERFRSFYELGLIGMAITSPDMEWVQCNDLLCRMLGYSREELLLKSELELTHPEELELQELQSRRVLAGEIDGYNLEKRFIRKDGGIIHTNLSVKCLRRPNGSVQQFIVLIDDITQRKEMETQLRDYSENLELLVFQRTDALEQANRELELRRNQAESANRAKSMFLAVMSHELRTPLNAILGLSEMLREGILGSMEPGQQKALATIEESGRHLFAVITDVLDLSKIEADRMELDLATGALEELCRGALCFVREPALKKKIALTYSMQLAPEMLHTDLRRLKQILVNLLSNAVKFTPEEGSVGLEVVGDEPRGVIRFIVRDTGIGIAPDDRQRLFHPFVQVDSSLARRFEGTGLGLALVARLTELLGGEVLVESELGSGSRFIIVLPWQGNGAEELSSPSPRETPSPEPVGSLGDAPLILLVEDSRASREMLQEYLLAQGCRTETALTGVEAVTLAGELRLDMILMDIQMPEMDGLTAIAGIRALPPPSNTVPIIAVTALAMPGDKERCLEAGADEYLGKPFALRELKSMIVDLLERVKNKSEL